MYKILASKSSFTTACNLRDEIFRITGRKYIVTSNANKIKNCLFRYGNVAETENDSLNTRTFTILCNNKLMTSMFLLGHDFYAPKFFQRERKPEKYPVLIRTTLTSCRGRGIHVIEDEKQFNNKWRDNYFWTPYIHTNSEFRVLMFDGEIVRLYKKEIDGEKGIPKYPIRGHNIYDIWNKKNPEKFPKLLELINNLHPKLKECGGVFYGVDVGWDAENKKWLIFEINSAPGLGENTVTEFAERICKKLNLEINMDA